MTDQAQVFSVDEKPREYRARFSVEGEIVVTVFADSLDEAKGKAEAMLDDDDFGHELDEVDLLRVGNVYKTLPMYRVIRDGQTMQVSRLEDGDLPRAPDESGF